jgi:hypothetical protein
MHSRDTFLALKRAFGMTAFVRIAHVSTADLPLALSKGIK